MVGSISGAGSMLVAPQDGGSGNPDAGPGGLAQTRASAPLRALTLFAQRLVQGTQQ